MFLLPLPSLLRKHVLIISGINLGLWREMWSASPQRQDKIENDCYPYLTKTGVVSDIKCLHYLVNTMPDWFLAFFFSFKNCPGKMTYFHSPTGSHHRRCWAWLRANENNLSGPLNGCLWVYNRSFICTGSLLESRVLSQLTVVHTPLCAAVLTAPPTTTLQPQINTWGWREPVAGDFSTEAFVYW